MEKQLGWDKLEREKRSERLIKLVADAQVKEHLKNMASANKTVGRGEKREGCVIVYCIT